MYFETVNRYWNFFEVQPQYLPEALESFIDIRGLHHPKMTHKSRAFYLFLRFVKNLRPMIVQYVDTVLASVQVGIFFEIGFRLTCRTFW